jgi:ribonuclease VapC
VIVDTSALVAILLREPEGDAFELAIAQAPFPKVSAATYFETGIVVDARRDPLRSRFLDSFLASAEIAIESVTPEQAIMARQAYQDFGRGSGHRAQLNFGDCFAYALAKSLDEELLFKGNDFSYTDVRAVSP